MTSEIDAFKVGDIVQVCGETFFSGLPYPDHWNGASIYAETFNHFGRVGIVEEVIPTVTSCTIVVKYLNSDEVNHFAPYQIKKLDNLITDYDNYEHVLPPR